MGKWKVGEILIGRVEAYIWLGFEDSATRNEVSLRNHHCLGRTCCTTCVAKTKTVIWLNLILRIFTINFILFSNFDQLLVKSELNSLLFEKGKLFLSKWIIADNSLNMS